MTNQKEFDRGITEGVIWRQLLKFFFPILLGTLFQQLYNTIDAVIVGKYVGTEALASVGGSAATLINLIVGFFVGLSSGASVVIAQYYGAHSKQEMHYAIHTAVALALLGGAVLMVIGFIITPPALRLLRTPDDTIGLSISYMRIYFLGMIPAVLYNMAAGILRAVGDARTPLWILIVCCIMNIALDLFFVVVLELSVVGVAIATSIAQLISAVLSVIVLMRTRDIYRLELKQIRLYPAFMKRMLYIGLPAGLQSAMYSISNLLIQAKINILGTDIVAAWAAFGKIDGIFWLVMNAFGMSILTFVGQNFGANNLDRVKKSVRICIGMAMGVALMFSAVILLFKEPLFSIFTDDSSVVAYGAEMVMCIAPFYFSWVCIEILSNTLRGMGDTVIPTAITCVGICVLRVAWAVIMSELYPGIKAIASSYPVTWFVTSAFFLFYYKKGYWMRENFKLRLSTKKL